MVVDGRMAARKEWEYRHATKLDGLHHDAHGLIVGYEVLYLRFHLPRVLHLVRNTTLWSTAVYCGGGSEYLNIQDPQPQTTGFPCAYIWYAAHRWLSAN